VMALPAGALALGRARQQNKPGWADERRQRRAAARADAEPATAGPEGPRSGGSR
jgi:hypothetical protein